MRAAHAPFAGIDPLSAQPDLLSEGELDRIASLAIKFAVACIATREFNGTAESGAQQVAGILPEDCLAVVDLDATKLTAASRLR